MSGFGVVKTAVNNISDRRKLGLRGGGSNVLIDPRLRRTSASAKLAGKHRLLKKVLAPLTLKYRLYGSGWLYNLVKSLHPQKYTRNAVVRNGAPVRFEKVDKPFTFDKSKGGSVLGFVASQIPTVIGDGIQIVSDLSRGRFGRGRGRRM